MKKLKNILFAGIILCLVFPAIAQIQGSSETASLHISNNNSPLTGKSQAGTLNVELTKIEGTSQPGFIAVRQSQSNQKADGQISGVSPVGSLHIGSPSTDNTGGTKKVETSSTSPSGSPVAEIDKDIPETKKYKAKTYALIIGNEDYHSHQTGLGSEIDVDFAARDAKIFKEYCTKTLGIPDKNITLLTDAKAVEIHRAVNKMNLLAKTAGISGELIFYYAGHGLPDEKTKEANLIPVDVSAKDMQFAIKLKDLYDKLTEHPTERVTVFLDACFSGGAREQGLVAARGVKFKPKENLLSGNLIVFSASSGEQSSLPYKEKSHGMFTYYLLKKIRESEGNLSYGELAEYLKNEVSINSLLINEKEQTPQVNVSNQLGSEWKNWKF